MSVSSDELPFDPLQDALVAFTGCIGEALEGICSYSLIIGETYVPFEPDEDDDCDEDGAACSQAWVRVTGIAPDATEGFDGGDCAAMLRVGLEVGVMRCTEAADNGEAPSATQVLGDALQAMEDMKKIYCAAMDCDAFEAISAGTWRPMGPLGMQYGGNWTFTVEV